MARSRNKLNEYVAAAGFDVYEKTPKAVFAAIAVSAVNCSDPRGCDHCWDEPGGPEALLLREWAALYNAGIVAQKPPAPSENAAGVMAAIDDYEAADRGEFLADGGKWVQ